MNVEDIQPGINVDKGVTIYTVISPPHNGVFRATGPDGKETSLTVDEVLGNVPGGQQD